METLLLKTVNWLNAEPSDSTIRLQRDGLYAFVGYADLTQPPVPLVTFRTVSWLLILAIGLPVVFLA